MNLQRIANAISLILFAYGGILLLPTIIGSLEREYRHSLPFLLTALLAIALGAICFRLGKRERDLDRLKRTEGLLIVTLTWVIASLLGALPYMFFGLSPVDACFESVSGFTTTGATILLDFSAYPHVFYFWRSLTQWLGGMGIIVLFVAILPQFGVAGRKLFFAEAPGPTEDKLTPRITQTAKALWLVYVLLTVAEMAALYAAGMPLFDALCNSLTTMAAGGFSPHPQSIMGYQSPTIIWLVTLFMFLAGTNFALQYRLLFERRAKPLLGNGEFQLYLAITVFASLALLFFLVSDEQSDLVSGWRDSLFQVVSILTTTGFSSADFALWAAPAQMVLLAMMFIGGCAGSAGGGVKVVRVQFVGKYLKREIDQLVHPRAVIPVKLNRLTVADDIQRQMLSFLMFYLVLCLLSGIAVTIIEKDASIGFVGTLATIGNVGPGFGEIGPMGSFGNLSPWSKLIFIVDMIAGRLELIPLLIFAAPEFWNIGSGK